MRRTIVRRYDIGGIHTFALGKLIQDKKFKDSTVNDKTHTYNKIGHLEKILATAKSVLANFESLAIENPSFHTHILSNLIVAKKRFWT